MNYQSRVIPLLHRSHGVEPGRPSPAAAAWPALILILLAGVGLFALADALTPAGAWRAITDSLTVALMFVAMAGWVRANRPALARIDDPALGRSPLEIRYVESKRHPQWRAAAKGPRLRRVRLMDARQDSPGLERS